MYIVNKDISEYIIRTYSSFLNYIVYVMCHCR